MKRNFLNIEQVNIPRGGNIYNKEHFQNLLPQNIDSIIQSVKSKLVYGLKLGNGNFGNVYEKEGMIFKELLWKGDYHDYGDIFVSRMISTDGKKQINQNALLEFEVLQYIKDYAIGVNTPEPILCLNNTNISNNINKLENIILFLKAIIKDKKFYDFMEFIGLKQIKLQLKNGLKSMSFHFYKKHFRANIMNIFNIDTITRPVIVMEKMKGKTLYSIDIDSNSHILEEYNRQRSILSNIGIKHDNCNFGNILYDEQTNQVNLIDFGEVFFKDNIIKKFEENKDYFKKKYPNIYREIFSPFL